jgi:hypothetical protein
MRKNRRIKRRRKRKKQAPLAFQAASTTEGSQKKHPFFLPYICNLKNTTFFSCIEPGFSRRPC